MTSNASQADEVQAEGNSDFKPAKYRADETEPDPRLRGNQMAMVFPPPMDDAALLQELRVEPTPFPEGWKEWVVAARLGLLDFITACHYVFTFDLDIAGKVLRLVRGSLINRDPREPGFMRIIMQIASGKLVRVVRQRATGAAGGLGLLIVGMSGVGKSSLLDRICAFLGAYGRIHSTINGRPGKWPQLGVIRINVQDDLKGTLRELIQEVNRQTGRAAHHAPFGASRSDLAERAVVALSTGFAPVVILDELQKLADLSPAVAKKILNFAIELMSVYGIPVVLVGTERVRQLFLLHKAELGKFTNAGLPHLGPLNEYDEDTANFIALLKRYSVSVSEIVYSEDFDRMLWVHSMGIRRIMVEYMRCVFERHAMDESIEVNAALLRSIAEGEMAVFQPVLSIRRKEMLGHKLTFDEQQEYEDFLEVALRARKQTEEQRRLQAMWLNQSHGDESALLSADEFLKLRAQLQEEQKAAKNGQRKEAAVVDVVEALQAAMDAPPTAEKTAEVAKARAKVKKGLGEAKQQLAAVNVVSIQAAAKRRVEAAEDEVDPGDIR